MDTKAYLPDKGRPANVVQPQVSHLSAPCTNESEAVGGLFWQNHEFTIIMRRFVSRCPRGVYLRPPLFKRLHCLTERSNQLKRLQQASSKSSSKAAASEIARERGCQRPSNIFDCNRPGSGRFEVGATNNLRASKESDQHHHR